MENKRNTVKRTNRKENHLTVTHNVEYYRIDQNLIVMQNREAISIHSQVLNHSAVVHNHTGWSGKAGDERNQPGKKQKGKLVESLLFHVQ